MTELIPFLFQAQDFSALILDDAPWFVAADAAAILQYGLTTDMTRQLDEDEQRMHNVHRLEGDRWVQRPMLIISESGLYNAIFSSRKPEAKALRRYVTGTVLPTLRRTGHFSMANASPQLSRIDMLARKIAHRPHITVIEAVHAAGLGDSNECRLLAANMLRALGWRKGYIAPETLLLEGPSS